MIQKVFGLTLILGSKNFGSQKYLGPKKILAQRNCKSKKNVWSEKIFVWEKFWVQNIFGSKIFLGPLDIGVKKFWIKSLVPKVFWSKNLWVKKKGWVQKNVQSRKMLGSKGFWVRKKFEKKNGIYEPSGRALENIYIISYIILRSGFCSTRFAFDYLTGYFLKLSKGHPNQLLLLRSSLY